MSNISHVLNSDEVSIFELCTEAVSKFPNDIDSQHNYLWKRMREIGYKVEVTETKPSEKRRIEKMSDATLAKFFPNIQICS
tara:strand:- start:182 stop:424 length:243 start_codon:yes stop_codon:yes gene_type:complete